MLSPAQRRRILTESDALNALFVLPDVELGQQLIELSRKAWLEIKVHLCADSDRLRSHQNSYLGSFFHALIPEIATRLGYQDFDDPLMDKQDIRLRLRSINEHDFRCLAGNIILNTPSNVFLLNRAMDTPTAFDILTHDVANGNPAAFALDRCAKPVEPVSKEDNLAWCIREVSLARGLTEQYCWTPAMQDYLATTE